MESLQFIIAIYMAVGTLCGICFEVLMTEVNMNNSTTNFERFTWIVFWPIYVLLFMTGIKK